MAKVTKTKDAICNVCGESMQINVLASLKTAKCEPCKANKKQAVKVVEHNGNPSVYGENQNGPRIDGRPNKAFENLGCPHHPQNKMLIIGVVKNELWGDLITLQCRQKGCWTVVNISEQSKRSGPLRTRVHGDGYEVDDIINRLSEDSDETLREWADERRKSKDEA